MLTIRSFTQTCRSFYNGLIYNSRSAIRPKRVITCGVASQAPDDPGVNLRPNYYKHYTFILA